MRFFARRITVWAISLCTACLFIISLLQYKADVETLEKKASSLSSGAPWGKNFHEDVRHLHAADVVANAYRTDRGVRPSDKNGRPAEGQFPGDLNEWDDIGVYPDDADKGDIDLEDVDDDDALDLDPKQVDLHVVPPTVKIPDRLYSYGQEVEDRVLKQLQYKLPRMKQEPRELQIYVSGGIQAEVKQGRQQFVNDECNVQHCFLHGRRDDGGSADAVLFQNHINFPSFTRPPNQLWAVFFLESPFHTTGLTGFENHINFTATYRRDSTIVAPYERFTFYQNTTKLPDKPSKNYAQGKTKTVAWFVSNCRTPNGRMEYVKELQNHITVDIYGHCGTLKCPRSKSKSCYELLNKDYMFYLAFENSNCKDYITEKLYWNALGNDVVPVVMGARPEDYHLSAPPGSYIHVDDFESPEKLAEYLLKVSTNETLYNSYFRWKGTGEFINTKFWCRLCAMVHYAQSHSIVYTDPHKWWNGPGICVTPDKDGNQWASWRGKNLHEMYPDAVQYGFQHT